MEPAIHHDVGDTGCLMQTLQRILVNYNEIMQLREWKLAREFPSNSGKPAA